MRPAAKIGLARGRATSAQGGRTGSLWPPVDVVVVVVAAVLCHLFVASVGTGRVLLV